MPLARPLCVALAVTALVALLSYALPEDWQSTGVGACLLVATYVLVLRKDAAVIRHHGLSLGGVFEPVPLERRRLSAAVASALGYAGLAAIVCFPPFWAGFLLWWDPSRPFNWLPPPSFESVLTQLLGIAMPEEMFYRGYVQTSIDDALRRRFRVLGARVGLGIVIGSAVFALGHFATNPHPARLAVFFPSLAFGWLRSRTRGIGASVIFHASCNLFSSYLAQGYFG
jgi:membrane protease YdiL (CAAX protease family)